MTTTNLADFGPRQMLIASALLSHYAAGLFRHPYWTNLGVQLMMNKENGNVFLSDAGGHVLMMNGFKLEPWYSLPYSGEQGFFEDFKIDATYHRIDVDYLELIHERTQ